MAPKTFWGCEKQSQSIREVTRWASWRGKCQGTYKGCPYGRGSWLKCRTSLRGGEFNSTCGESESRKETEQDGRLRPNRCADTTAFASAGSTSSGRHSWFADRSRLDSIGECTQIGHRSRQLIRGEDQDGQVDQAAHLRNLPSSTGWSQDPGPSEQ